MPPADPGPTGAGRFDVGIQPGSSVDVRSRFDGSWSRGFAVAEVVGGGDGPGEAVPRYRLRRQSDGALLPRLFAPNEVTLTQRNRSGWKQFPRT
jgi:hypothetical protein